MFAYWICGVASTLTCLMVVDTWLDWYVPEMED